MNDLIFAIMLFILIVQAGINFSLLYLHRELIVIETDDISEFKVYDDKKRLRAAIHESGHTVCLDKCHKFTLVEIDTELFNNKKIIKGSGRIIYQESMKKCVVENCVLYLGGLAAELEYVGKFYSSSSKSDLNAVKDLIKNTSNLPEINFIIPERKFDIVSCYKEGTFTAEQKIFLRKVYAISRFKVRDKKKEIVKMVDILMDKLTLNEEEYNSIMR